KTPERRMLSRRPVTASPQLFHVGGIPMSPRNVLAFWFSVVLAMPVLAQPSDQTQAPKAPRAAPSQPVFMPAADLKWTDLDPNGAPGVKVADLWGDHAKGAFGAFLKLPAGFAAPLHH